VVGYRDHQTPSIAAAIAECVESGLRRIIAVPYFIQMGGHVRNDLPAA